MSVKEMLDVGAHFGHPTSQWNPAMKPYIYGARNGIHIINLQKTAELLEQACQFVKKVVSEGGDLLMVGTKRQAQAIVAEEAKRCQMYYVDRRWLGGTLTNYRTIKASIQRLKELEKKREEGGFEGLTKKEKLGIEREIQDLTRSLGGIKEMERLPAAVFLVDALREHIALREAIRLGIPVIGLIDTNSNPGKIDYVVPANDDSIKSIRFFCHQIAEAALEGIQVRDQVARARMARETGEIQAPLPRERVIQEKGKAFVSRPESYEKDVGGAYSQNDAKGEAEPLKEKLS